MEQSSSRTGRSCLAACDTRIAKLDSVKSALACDLSRNPNQDFNRAWKTFRLCKHRPAIDHMDTETGLARELRHRHRHLARTKHVEIRTVTDRIDAILPRQIARRCHGCTIGIQPDPLKMPFDRTSFVRLKRAWSRSARPREPSKSPFAVTMDLAASATDGRLD